MKDVRDSNEVNAVVRRWLGREPGYLLILDSADDPALVKPFLPPDPKGHVLLTSRARISTFWGSRADRIADPDARRGTGVPPEAHES